MAPYMTVKQAVTTLMPACLTMQAIARHGRTVTADYLADMPYAEMTCRETLRLAIVIAQLPRRAQSTFEIGGYTVPKVRLW